ncbi:hypothetical protein E2C01_038824 [Portunus trituberculatus]|uniref:Uncharacterized protein n=1 Tax=Portunus trituberculatus TaxID=210409 RepID=A0A5B7FJ06_PORTR|nr:hypothetical protein [Portunus trituberculatus]
MSLVKGHSGGSTHLKGADQCSGGGGGASTDKSNTSGQLDPEPSTSTADMGGDQKFSSVNSSVLFRVAQ